MQDNKHEKTYRGKKPVSVHRDDSKIVTENLKSKFHEVKTKIGDLPQQSAADQQEKEISPFRYDSTATLLKKFFIYKMMSSNIFINYSLMGMNISYKLLGIKLTNWAIESTAGSIFTGGVSINDVVNDIKGLQEKKIGGIACYVVEGVRDPSDSQLDNFTDFTLESITALTNGDQEGHFALKLTAFIGMDALERISLAQERFVSELLELSTDPARKNEQMDFEKFVKNLHELGITDYQR